MTLDEMNHVGEVEAGEFFRQCCSSERWIRAMIEGRPYSDASALQCRAVTVWDSLEEQDYLQAFAGHPKIGDINSLKDKYAMTKTVAASEQQGMAAASEEVIAKLSQGNALYEQRFGFIFIVCATGKSADEMCNMLYHRLANHREDELRIAVEEQKKILLIRLEKTL